MRETGNGALVVAVETRTLHDSIEEELAEFEALAEAAGASVLDRMVQRRDAVDPATLVGSGKAREIAQRAHENQRRFSSRNRLRRNSRWHDRESRSGT